MTGMLHIAVIAKEGERVYAGFHIQNINADCVAVIEPSLPNA